LYDLVDTKNVTLDTTYWENLLKAIMNRLKKEKVYVPAIVQDNESSPLSGSTKIQIELFPHLIIIRCAAHTIELLQACVIASHTALVQTCKGVVKLAKIIRAHKFWLQKLYDFQKQCNAEATPVTLVLPCNTRKWSSTFLVLRRALEVKATLAIMSTVTPPVGVPSLPNITWEDVLQCADILGQFHAREVAFSFAKSTFV